jgi:hypothetical protein
MKYKARQPERHGGYCAMGQEFDQVIQHPLGPDLFILKNIVQFTISEGEVRSFLRAGITPPALSVNFTIDSPVFPRKAAESA